MRYRPAAIYHLPFQIQPIQLYIADGRLKAGVIGHIIKLPDSLQLCCGLGVDHKLLLQQSVGNNGIGNWVGKAQGLAVLCGCLLYTSRCV